jgi:hypothetical protein
MEEYDGIVHGILVEITNRWRAEGAAANTSFAREIGGRADADDLDKTVILSADMGRKEDMPSLTEEMKRDGAAAEDVDSMEETVMIRLSDGSKRKRETE